MVSGRRSRLTTVLENVRKRQVARRIDRLRRDVFRTGRGLVHQRDYRAFSPSTPGRIRRSPARDPRQRDVFYVEQDKRIRRKFVASGVLFTDWIARHESSRGVLEAVQTSTRQPLFWHAKRTQSRRVPSTRRSRSTRIVRLSMSVSIEWEVSTPSSRWVASKRSWRLRIACGPSRTRIGSIRWGLARLRKPVHTRSC